MQFRHKYCMFLHLLKRVDFDASMDHLALMYIIKSTTEPATTITKRFYNLSVLTPLICTT